MLLLNSEVVTKKNKSYWFCLEHIDLELLCAPAISKKVCVLCSIPLHSICTSIPTFPPYIAKTKNSSEKFSFGNIFYIHIYINLYVRMFSLLCFQLTSSWSSTILGQTPHQCEVCGKKYTRKEHLANHMRSHTNDTPFRCEICGKSFSRKEHFTNHILWHTGM